MINLGFNRVNVLALFVAFFFSSIASGNVLLRFPHTRLGTVSFLYLKSGDNLLQYICSYDVINPSPNKCRPDIAVRNASKVYSHIEARVLKSAPELEVSISELASQITVIDTKMESMDFPSDDEYVRLAIINATKSLELLRAEHVAFTTELLELKQQLVAIQNEMDHNTSDDLRLQYLELKSKIYTTNVSLNAKLLEIEKARQLWMDAVARSKGNLVQLKALRSQREKISERYVALLSALNGQVKELAEMQIFIRQFLEDESFIYEIFYDQLGSDAYPFIQVRGFPSDFEATPKE